jgi:hypothetical protein
MCCFEISLLKKITSKRYYLLLWRNAPICKIGLSILKTFFVAMYLYNYTIAIHFSLFGLKWSKTWWLTNSSFLRWFIFRHKQVYSSLVFLFGKFAQLVSLLCVCELECRPSRMRSLAVWLCVAVRRMLVFVDWFRFG